MSDFDGQTPDQLRAAEKRAAAARAAAGDAEKAEPEARTEAPKGRRSKPTEKA